MADEPTLKRGHSNPHDWVVYAQKTLNYALAGGMHLDVPENGVFDDDFEQEVVAFQTQHGLDHDGVGASHSRSVGQTYAGLGPARWHCDGAATFRSRGATLTELVWFRRG